MPSPLVSVVIPTLNESKYISACINSFRRQSVSNFEVIVVDSSNDSTPSMCRKAGWRVIRQSGRGVAQARKQGFSVARGSIIASTDADTAVHPRWIESIISGLTNPKVICVYGPTYFDSPRIFHKLSGIFGAGFQLVSRAIGKDALWGMNFAVRKSAYLKIGGFDPGRITAEDFDLGLRLRSTGQILFNPQMIVHTSPRRLTNFGPAQFITHHAKNYFRMLLFDRSSTHFPPIR